MSSGRAYLPSLPVLLLARDGLATRRRGPPVPALSCLGGPAANATETWPAAVECVNDGVGDDGKVMWDCEGRPRGSGFAVEGGRVLCEGFAFDGDDWVLEGSCSFEYRLGWTEGGSKVEGASVAGIGGDVGGSGFKFVAVVVVAVGALMWCRWWREIGSGGERMRLIA